MRTLIIALALGLASPATAQTTQAAPAAPSPARIVAGLWRPLPPREERSVEAWLAAACEGASAEMAAVESALPEQMTPEALAAVRAPRGLIVVPADDDATRGFIFPNAELSALTSGAAFFVATDPAQGRLDITDAAGRTSQFRLGRAANGHPMMQIPHGGGAPLVYVGCATSAASGG